MAPSTPQDLLTATVYNAVEKLTRLKRAGFLLNTALALIESGQYGEDVENYLEVYFGTPGLPKEDVIRALLARGNARKLHGERSLALAQQDLHSVIQLAPVNKHVQTYFRQKSIRFLSDPACQRAPPEIWERIAAHIPRYHLRTWLFVSAFHRDIASRYIFHTIDIYFGEDTENLNRGLDIFDRAKNDPIFASRVKSLRLHWAYEEGDMLDLMIRIFKTSLPEFKALQDFEWIGYPEMGADVVQTVLATHKHLHGLGLIGWHFDAVGVSAFCSLRKFTLRAEDDDGFADMGEIRTVLDRNRHTLRHLILGAYLARDHSWDLTLESPTIKNLTHLDLVDTRISHFVFTRIAHAHNLQSLTLHGTFEEPKSASIVFASDHIIEGQHTFLPQLEAFRFMLVGHDEEHALYRSVTLFLRKRERLRRLDLGNCPWDMVRAILPDFKNLRVLGIRIANLTQDAVETLVESIPRQMVAINLATIVSDKPMNEYARFFTPFSSLSFLHLQCSNMFRPKPNVISEKNLQVQTDLWFSSVRSIATTIPSLDFLGWHGEPYVVVRTGGNSEGDSSVNVELKELPTRRRLDCGKGVDLGGEDAAWLERKDVPMDYEKPGLY